MTSALVLPSPFLPADVHAPLADALGRRGWGVVVSEPPVAPADAAPVLAVFLADARRVRPDVVLAHSNAGRYAAHVAPPGAVVVYVDAALPPEAGDAPLAPPALADALASVTGEDGLMPPWTRWWDEDDLAPVVPDAVVLARIRAAEPRVPLSYLRARLAAPDGWRSRPSAYLAFGGTYGPETELARELGWPVEVVAGAAHLHHLLDPEGVADAVVLLAAALRAGRLRTAPARRGRTTG